MGLQISLLGSFELVRDVQPAPTLCWPSENTKSLLKILAGERGRLFLHDELIEYLWPDLDPEKAAANLRGRITELRKILEPGLARRAKSQFVITAHGGYVLHKDADCWIDIEAFSRFESLGRQHEKEDRLKEAMQSYASAIQLCRGEYLAEDRYAEWAIQPRARWKERQVDLLARMAACLARLEEWREALAYLRKAIALAPTQEVLYQEWIRCAHKLGDSVQVRQAYEACASTLQKELDLSPSAQTRKLYEEAISAAQPTVAPTHTKLPEVLDLSQRLQRPPFVGRSNEWSALLEIARAARAATGKIVMISGELGIGKTRLIHEFTEWAKSHLRARVLVGRCYELETPLAFQPLLEAISAALPYLASTDFQGLHRAWLSELVELIPELAQLVPDLHPVSSLPPEYRHTRLFGAFHQILCSFTQRHSPVMLWLEDLQWASPSTIDFLSYLLNRLESLPLIITATYRPEEVGAEHSLHRLLQHGTRLGCLQEFRLAPFSLEELNQLLQGLSMRWPDNGEVLSSLHRRSEGNPLLVLSQLQVLLEEEFSQATDPTWQLPDAWPSALPAFARELIRHRIERMPLSRQRVLHIISIWAEEIPVTILEKIWDASSEELQNHLHELVSAGFLVFTEKGYAYTHHMHRHVVYETLMDEPRRKWLHWQAVLCLRAQGSRHAPQWRIRLAYHSERAGHPLWAIHYLVQALYHCRNHRENEEGLRLAERGLRLLEQLEQKLTQRPSLRRRWLNKKFQLLREEAWIQRHRGHRAGLETVLTRLKQLKAQLSENLRQQADVEYLQGALYVRSSQYQRALECLQTACSLYQQLQDTGGEAASYLEMGHAHFDVGSYAQAHDRLTQSLVLFEKVGDRENQAEVCLRLGHIAMRQGDSPRANECYQKALDLSRRAKSEQMEGKTLRALSYTHLQEGRYEKVLQMCEQAQKIAEKLGDLRNRFFSLSNQATAFYFLGRLGNAADCCQQALKLATDAGNPIEHGQICRQFGRILREEKQFTQSLAYINRALEIFEGAGARHDQAEALRARAETELATSTLGCALSDIHEALRIASELKLAAVSLRCRATESLILLELERHSEALGAAKEVLQSEHAYMLGKDQIARVHFTCFHAACSLDQHAEALEYLKNAQSLVSEMAQLIENQELRQSFFAARWHRDLIRTSKDFFGQAPS